MTAYDAFISYSHARDKPVAAALQSTLETIGKPWYRRRSLVVFRDDACLAATPTLWPAIEVALNHSRYLLLLASPQAAESDWVAREVEHWLAHKSVDTILIAVTSGQLEWDTKAGDFLWNEFTPLPTVLKGKFALEPKWVEMHSFRRRAPRTSRRFADMSATLAAAIHGMSKDTLLSKEVWQQRRALMLATGVAGALLVLGLTSAWYWREAVEAKQVATLRRDEIEAQHLQSERTLLTAARSTNAMIIEIAREFARRTDLPAELVQNVLYRAQFLQDQLAETVLYAPDLMRSNLTVLGEIANALKQHRDFDGAIAVAQRCVSIASRLVAERPQDVDRARDLAWSHDRAGDMLLAASRRDEALAAYRAAAVIREKLAAADPANKELQDEVERARQRVANTAETRAQ